MQVIPLGLITVAAAGSPTAITQALITAAGGPTNGRVAKIEVWANPSASGVVSVKGANGNVIAKLPVPANGHAEHWHACAEENQIQATAFSLDVATNGDGAFVTLTVQ